MAASPQDIALYCFPHPALESPTPLLTSFFLVLVLPLVLLTSFLLVLLLFLPRLSPENGQNATSSRKQ